MTRILAATLVFLVSATAPLSPALAPPEPDIPALLREAEVRQGLPDYLLHAICQVESRMDPEAIGAQGEVGLLQLHPKWHDVSGGVPAQIDTAARYLRAMIDRYGLDLGIAAYNQGPSRPVVVGAYVRRVYRAWEVWRNREVLR